MTNKYILDDNGDPVAEPDLMKWAVWFERSNLLRHIGNQELDQSRVSTVFLGVDHSYNDGPPLLWETMVFGGKLDQEQARCGGSREQAEAMHARMVERVKASQ